MTYGPDDFAEEPPDWFDDLYSKDPRNPGNHPDDEPPSESEDLGGAYDEHEGRPPEIEWFCAADLDGQPVPAREWLIEDWLPVGCVTSLYGKGGTGKSLLAMQAATAVATGSTFFGLRTTQARVLGVFCEDDQGELHRRQAAICQDDIPLADLKDFLWLARAGEQNSLVHEVPGEPGKLDWSGLFMAVEENAKALGARLVILDNIAQMFGANENDRALVTSFVNRLQRLAMGINGAVLLLGHPGKGGVAQAYSGSTAWDAAVRSRWWLKRPEAEEDDEEPNELLRELVKDKSNYSGTGDTIVMEWTHGCFHRVGGESFTDRLGEKMATSARESQISALILQALDTLRRQKRHVSASRNASNGAVKTLAGMGEFKKVKARRKEIDAALERLFSEGRIRAGMAVWQRPNRHWAEGIGRVEWSQPDRPTAAVEDEEAEDESPETGEEGIPP